ncbi:glucoamylase family protein [Aureimonas leprariae]|uniref:Beta-glucosidase n=1 Tax=Plantimonas leprariae TaxID=2615207 RepID=A0A7V7PMK9_9HYPH|nr:glucoamylase family protein [Aureimonas leprariae]KAB0678490.1 beta-glucosidase [Aureimonas leprariae]
MPRSGTPERAGAASSGRLTDEELLDRVQRQSFRYFWEGGHPASGLARDRIRRDEDPRDDKIAIGASGFGVMAIVVACERGWVTRSEAVARIGRMLGLLTEAPCYHGMFPHFMNGATGAVVPFGRKDDGGDIVESALLLQGLLCARAYFHGESDGERRLRGAITYLWNDAEWDWYARGRDVLTWHWSPTNGFALDHAVRGWNECLIAYVLAASSPTHPIAPAVYHRGYAEGRVFLNHRLQEGIELPLGPDGGGPLFFAHYSFCGLDPRDLSDTYADYWQQNVRHTLVNRAYCIRNPKGFKGYGPDCWGLTASDSVGGYDAHAPNNDLGVVSPTAALSSLPYAPAEAMAVLRHLHDDLGDRLWGRYGFLDAFSEEHGWVADWFLGIDQGPIVTMIENHRSGLMWRLFMSVPEVRTGLKRLGFEFPALTA